MITVHKYSVPFDDNFSINMPTGAEILTFQLQGGGAYIWCKVDTEATPVARNFRLAGTGHPLPIDKDIKHIGTVQLNFLVLHLFEISQTVT